MLANAQQTDPVTTSQMYSADPYANINDVNHMSPIQTTTNNFNNMTNNNQVSNVQQNVLKTPNNQLYQNKLLMNMQQQGNLQNQMTIEQQSTMNAAHDNNNSYKSPQSPSFRTYHHSNQQPYKIPSQNSGYNATNRIMMRQQSPPHNSSSLGEIFI